MPKIIFDTNILLDYFGACANPEQTAEATELIACLRRHGCTFLVTPAIVKDFHYVLASRLKRAAQEEKGSLSEDDARAIAECAFAATDLVLELGSVASEGSGDCAIARSLCKQHPDFEDCLIAAVALRMHADCIVTRDGAFAAHCPVACLSPADARAAVEAGIYA